MNDTDADVVFANNALGDDQRTAVHALVTGGEQLALLVGPAGTGKSRSLDAARMAWEHSGYRVIGLAPSAMAAAVLQEESGIQSETLAMFLLRSNNSFPHVGLNSRTVVVLDEASMARTVDLVQLVHDTAQARAKLVLVGGPHQLGAVGAGGIFRTLVNDREREGSRVAELETVRRFHHAWEAAASLRLRANDPSILTAYQRHDRIAGGTREEMIDAAFHTWQEQREQGRSVVVMTGDNTTVDEIARRCRAERVARGEVEQDGVHLERGTVGVGDEIVTLRNDRSLRTEQSEFVHNGERLQVTARDQGGALSVSSLDGRGSLTLPPSYVHDHVALAYALTVHKAQGATTDAGVLVVEPSMAAQQLYVGMGRGRQVNRALVICEELDLDHGQDKLATPIEVLGAVMRRDDGDRSAHEVMREELSRYENRALLSDLLEEAKRYIDRRAGPDRSVEIKEGSREHDRAVEMVTAARDAALHAENDRRMVEERTRDIEQRLERVRMPGHNELPSPVLRSQLQRAEEELRATERQEHAAWRSYEHTCYRMDEAMRSNEGLHEPREAQARRDEWIDQHQREVEWAHALEERLTTRTHEAEMEPTAPSPERDLEHHTIRYPTHEAVHDALEQANLALKRIAAKEEKAHAHESEGSSFDPVWRPDFLEDVYGDLYEGLAALDSPDLGPGGPQIGM